MPAKLTRHLHARFAKHASHVLTPQFASLPARGLLIGASPLLPALWALGGFAHSSPAALLVRSLYHRHEPQEPLRRTRNRSLPGCHAAEDLRLQGHILGLAISGASEADAVNALRSSGLAPLARTTKVSLARFARLATLARAGLSDRSYTPALLPSLCTSTILMAFAWTTAHSKAELLSFFEAAAQHLPPGTLLSGRYDAASSAWRDAWLTQSFERDEAADGTKTALGATKTLARASADDDPTSVAEALELLAFALACRGSERPEVEQVCAKRSIQAAIKQQRLPLVAVAYRLFCFCVACRRAGAPLVSWPDGRARLRRGRRARRAVPRAVGCRPLVLPALATANRRR